MADKTVKFTFRVNDEIIKKFHYIAGYHARSANGEMEILVKKHIAEFEKKHGKIAAD